MESVFRGEVKYSIDDSFDAVLLHVAAKREGKEAHCGLCDACHIEEHVAVWPQTASRNGMVCMLAILPGT